jgi:hypothetical protein
MEQISRLELDRLVELYDLAHNADFSDASDKSPTKRMLSTSVR